MKRTEPTTSLLQGGVYVPAAHTDIRVSFARVRAQLGVAVAKPAPTQAKPLQRVANGTT